MPFRQIACVTVVFFAGSVSAAGGDWVLRGRVVDEQGKPAAGVDVTTNWNANGFTLAELKKFQKEGGDSSEHDQNEGRMEPWGSNPVQTDAAGQFVLTLNWRQGCVLAMDKERKLGALYLRETEEVPSGVELQLVPLVRVHGRLTVPAIATVPEWTVGIAQVQESENRPLRFGRIAECTSRKGTFEMRLPPGEYQIEAAAEHGGQRYENRQFKQISVPAGWDDFDCGVVELMPEVLSLQDRIDQAKSEGKFAVVDHTKLYGEPAPDWHATDARGISKTAIVADLRGKWVLVYFFQPWCAPCLGKTLPELMAFYDAHETQRDQFEIVSVCIDPELTSVDNLEREWKNVIQNVWKRQLPFPLVIDNTLKTIENYGEGARLGTGMLLIDPEGILVEGDLKTLGEKLAQLKPM